MRVARASWLARATSIVGEAHFPLSLLRQTSRRLTVIAARRLDLAEPGGSTAQSLLVNNDGYIYIMNEMYKFGLKYWYCLHITYEEAEREKLCSDQRTRTSVANFNNSSAILFCDLF